PVRSGQQVYAADGDLTLLGPVSAGAEVLADGSIHVYGPLRGRALAGVRGKLEARIFCLGLEAELVSVAGRYRILEKNGEGWGKAVQIYLSGEHLIIEPLTVEAGAHRKS
ncbi:MAG TPA: septum site-determining protein MinC, partial [Plasticicumulans sp.]|nr:septum site-determining protein MinC [Plasticicumulans sp.]